MNECTLSLKKRGFIIFWFRTDGTVVQRGVQEAAKILYLLCCSLLFPTVKEFSKSVNSWWSCCKNSTSRFFCYTLYVTWLTVQVHEIPVSLRVWETEAEYIEWAAVGYRREPSWGSASWLRLWVLPSTSVDAFDAANTSPQRSTAAPPFARCRRRSTRINTLR